MDGTENVSKWRGLLRTGGIAALVMAAVIVAGSVTFVISPPPTGSVTQWFALFERNGLLGMMDMDLVMLVGFVALIPVVMALYVVLHRAAESAMVLATGTAGVAIATHFASSRVFEMLALSRQYALATTAAGKASLEAAGQSMLTTYLGSFGGPAPMPGWNYQGTAFNVSFVLWSLVGIAVSVVMVRSGVFGRVAGWLGAVGFAAALGLFLPGIGVTLSLVSIVLQLVWYVMVGLRLMRLARNGEVAV